MGGGEVKNSGPLGLLNPFSHFLIPPYIIPLFFQANILVTSGKAEDSSDVIIWEPLDQNWNMVARFLSLESLRDK